MANITDIERLNYYEGEFLGAVDFQAEQEYHRDMRRRHNLGQHTWGIVSGLDLVQVPNGGTTPPPGNLPTVDIYLQPGVAVDAFGREIVVLNKTQLTQDLFAAYGNLTGLHTMYIWISYAQLMLQPPADACTALNQPNAFGRLQEAFALTATNDSKSPPNGVIVVDGKTLPLPTPLETGDIVFPPDDSIPYQEFSTDDSAIWYVALGRVSWDASNGVFVQQTKTNLDDTWLAVGRQYAGIVASTIYAPAASTTYAPGPALTLKDRFTVSPLPAGSNGVSVEVEGSLTVDLLLDAEQNILVGSAFDPNSKLTMSPVTINASSADQSFIQFRDSSGPQFSIWETPATTSPKNPAGLNFGETDTNGNPTTSDLFIQGGKVGIGTSSPSQNLSVNGGLNIDQGHNNDGSKLNPGLSFGPNGTEGIASSQSGGGTNQTGLDFYTLGKPRLRITKDGSVSIGTPTSATTPTLSVSGAESATHGFAAAIGISNTAPAGRNWYFRAGAAGTATPAGGLSIADDTAYRLVVDSSGNVGIGTTAPTALLDVAGNTQLEGNLKVTGNQNIFGVKTFLMALSNQNTTNNFRAWNVDYTNLFEFVYAVFAVFQGYSVFNNDNNFNFDSFGNVPGGQFIPQHTFVRVDSHDVNTARGVCFCSESDITQEGDNTVFFTVVVLGKPKF
jgi:hypothetical protein